MLARCGDERLVYFVDVAAVSHAHGNAKPHTWIAIMPVRYRRIDKFRVRHDHRDIIARHDNRAARANLLHSADDACHFYAVPDCDGSFCQNDETADEIAGDVLQTKSNPYANRAGKNRQCSQVNPSVLQHNENADHQDDVAENLGNRVLERAVESTVSKKAI